MTTDKVIHWLTVASSALAALLAFDHAAGPSFIPAGDNQAIITGVSAAIAAIGAVLTVLRGKSSS